MYRHKGYAKRNTYIFAWTTQQIPFAPQASPPYTVYSSHFGTLYAYINLI